jgi:hypothetical protein
MTITERVITKLARLTDEQQREVLEYVERLESQAKKPTIDPYGTSADLRTDLPFEEFQKNRQEMWGDATEQEL